MDEMDEMDGMDRMDAVDGVNGMDGRDGRDGMMVGRGASGMSADRAVVVSLPVVPRPSRLNITDYQH